MTAVDKAATRAAGAQRALVGLIGLLSLATGTAALIVGSGLLGTNRAARPILDPIAVDTVGTHQTLARSIAIAAGVVLLVLGLLWAARALKPERRPNLILDFGPERRLEISASAIADALRADVEAIDGVSRARARMTGKSTAPILRLNLWLEDGADVRDIYQDLDTRVLTRARDSFGVRSLPTAIRMELDTAAPARVR
ncbi:MAG: alkaline shock response membrane anchor protein AmaP [Actinomycetota bacterium]|nr:alkaline shock response membrane anchor protein AmaP [Actinomycetota bacterium]